MAAKCQESETLLSSELESDIKETQDSDQNDDSESLGSFSSFITSDDDSEGCSSPSKNSKQRPPGKKPKIT